MKVEQLINQLKKNHKPDDNLIVTYWTRDKFRHIPEDLWSKFALLVESEMDWCKCKAWNAEEIGWMWKRKRWDLLYPNKGVCKNKKL